MSIRKIMGPVLCAVLLLSVSAPSFAAAYIKIADIKGESTDSAHKEWIEVLSVKFGQAMRGSQGKSGPGTLRISKRVDQTTPLLMNYCATAKPLKSATLDVEAPAGTTRYKLTKIMLTSCSDSARDRSVQTEILSMDYSSATWHPAGKRAKR